MTETTGKWRQVAACFILQAISAGAITSSFSVLAVPFGAQFSATQMVVMLAMTALMLVTALFSPLAGRLLDQVSIKTLMFSGAGALAAGFALASVATDFTQIIIIYAILLAPANVLIGPLAASVQLSRWFDRDRGRALGIAAIGISVGGLTLPPIIQQLILVYGWRPALQILAVVLMVIMAIACSLLTDRKAHADGLGGLKKAEAMTAATIMRSGDFWRLTMVFGVLLTGMMGLVTNMVPIARDRGISLADATLLISGLSLGSLLGKVSFAALSDRLSQQVMLIFGLSGFFVGMSCFVIPQWGFGALLTGAAIIGFTNGGAIPLQPIICARIFGLANVGRVVGLLNLTIMIGGFIVPPAFGMVRDQTGGYYPAFLIYLVLAALALLPILMMRTRPTDSADLARQTT